MAATKKSIAIQGQKRELANGILFLNAQILECANKVPPIVLNGSHQIAVAWKEVAESVFKRDLSGAPGSMTVEALSERLAKKTQILKKLKGEGLLT